jgi:hypothetical protein
MNAAAAVTQPRFSAATNVGARVNSAAANVGPRVSNVASNIGPRLNSATKNMSFGSNSMPSSSSSSSDMGSGSLLSGWGLGLVMIVVLIAVFAVYYKTIGYYIQIGWDKLKWSHDRGEKVEIQVPGGASATLMPAMGGGDGSSIGDSLGGAIKNLESDVEAALGAGPGKKQVFNVSRNVYTFAEAEPLCRAFGAELATYDQVKAAYESGADWCNYGWAKGQLAVYPTQEETYRKLQQGPEGDRMSCGVPGVNGGYFPNAEQRFGVNCYGARPAETALDERMQMEEHSNIAFDREVNKFKSELDSIGVNPWSSKQWSD